MRSVNSSRTYKNWVFLVFLLITSGSLWTQTNLVPNPGFEDLYDCQPGYNNIETAEFWLSLSDRNIFKPSVFHGCSSYFLYTPPTAGSEPESYQKPRSGTAHAHILGFVYMVGWKGLSYLQNSLVQPLEQDKLYYIRFYASPDITYYELYTDALGLLLTTEEQVSNDYTYEGNGVYLAEPDIKNQLGIITDTVGWSVVNGVYRARGDETHFLIGNFRSVEETDWTTNRPNTAGIGLHYFIDDVGIYLFDPLPNDTLLCDGETVEFDASFLEASYRWSTGDTTRTLSIDRAGLYYVDVDIEGVTMRDSVRVYIEEPAQPYFDTLLCDDVVYELAPGFYGNYEWNTGDTEPSITVRESGTYEALISNACTEFLYEATITFDDCQCEVYLPNAFSPNYDGVNDDFEASLSCVSDYTATLEIYDRFGGQMFSREYRTGERPRWRPEATHLNGVYVYVLHIETAGRERTYSGSVTLLR